MKKQAQDHSDHDPIELNEKENEGKTAVEFNGFAAAATEQESKDFWAEVEAAEVPAEDPNDDYDTWLG
jgi:hypothetical protein